MALYLYYFQYIVCKGNPPPSNNYSVQAKTIQRLNFIFISLIVRLNAIALTYDFEVLKLTLAIFLFSVIHVYKKNEVKKKVC